MTILLRLNMLVVATVCFCQSSWANYEVEKLMDSYLIAKADTPALSDEEVKATPYTIQVASYINEKDAASYVEELKVQEKEVYYFPAFVRGQVWFKVCVGKFTSKNAAEEYKRAFVKRMDEPFATVISLLDRPTSKDEKQPARATASVEPKAEERSAMPVPELPAVEAPVAQAPAAPAPAPAQEQVDAPETYSLQVGAFPTEDLAKEHLKKLPASLVQEAYYKAADVNGKTWYRLFVGKFKSRAEAQGYQKTFQNESRGAESLVRKMSAAK